MQIGLRYVLAPMRAVPPRQEDLRLASLSPHSGTLRDCVYHLPERDVCKQR